MSAIALPRLSRSTGRAAGRAHPFGVSRLRLGRPGVDPRRQDRTRTGSRNLESLRAALACSARDRAPAFPVTPRGAATGSAEATIGLGHTRWATHGATAPETRTLAEQLAWSPFFLYLGRLSGVPVALESALKLKEIPYVPTEAYMRPAR